MANLKIPPKDVVIVSGIGCSSKITDYFKSYGFHSLHGRALPIATAIKLANPKLRVIVATGDGDCYAIGMGHFIHAVRRNVGITCLVMNNQVYGLTKGQYSPTASVGFATGSSPYGSIESPIDGLSLALTAGATYVARSYSGNIAQTTRLLEGAIKHNGFALVDDLSPCVTFNKVNTYAWYQKNIDDLEKDPGYAPNNRQAALQRCMRTDKIPVGLIYREVKMTFEENLLRDLEKPIALADLSPDLYDYAPLMEEFQ